MIRQYRFTDSNKLGDAQVYAAQLIEQVTHMVVDNALHGGEIYLHTRLALSGKGGDFTLGFAELRRHFGQFW